jgi:hypothetical protein
VRIAGFVARLLLGLVAALLLTSIGGAGIFAAPVTLPLLWLAAATARPAGRFALNAVAALTAAEVAWAVSYDRVPGVALEWAVPLAALAFVAALYPVTQRRAGLA